MEIENKVTLVVDKSLQVLAVLCLSAYVISAVNAANVPVKFVLHFVFVLGVMGIVTLSNIYLRYNFDAKKIRYYKIGTLLLVLAFFQFTLMTVVQQAMVITRANPEFQKPETIQLFSLLNSVHLGMDVVFEIFYSFGILLVSVSFIAAGPKTFTGWYGVIMSLSLLVLNLYSFPIPPKENGLVDLGVLTIPWWIIFIIKIKKSANGKNIW